MHLTHPAGLQTSAELSRLAAERYAVLAAVRAARPRRTPAARSIPTGTARLRRVARAARSVRTGAT